VWTLAIDPTDPSTIYAGVYVNGVFKSTNGGGVWKTMNTGITFYSDPGNSNDIVRTIVIDPTNHSTIYAGLFPRGIYKSTNGGDNWNVAGLPDAYVRILVIDPSTPNTIYAGIHGGVIKSTNGGDNWSPVNNGLTDDDVRALVIDPMSPSTLYAGTDSGVFKSTTSGDAWVPFNNGLTSTTVVFCLALGLASPSTLYAGTDVSGVFSIQQVAVLAINYSSGAPGSYFTITGSNFPPDSTATITVNGNVFGTVPTDSSGSFTFLLRTIQADEGFYRVTASVNPSASTQFTLNKEDALHPQEGSGTVFDVPDGIAYHFVYLPLIVK